MSAHATMARYARALNYSGGELAAALGVSPGTAYGWLQVAAGEPVSPRRPGHAAPSPELLAKARALVEAHVEHCKAALLGEDGLDKQAFRAGLGSKPHMSLAALFDGVPGAAELAELRGSPFGACPNCGDPTADCPCPA